MSRWADQVGSVRFQGSLTAFKERLESVRALDGLDELQALELARAAKVFAYLESFLEQVDPDLAPIGFFSTLSQHLRQSTDELNNFAGTKNSGHLQAANNHLDGVLTAISSTPFVVSSAQKGAITRAASAYASAVTDHIARLRELAVQAKAEFTNSKITLETSVADAIRSLDALRASIDSTASSAQVQLAQFNAQFSASESGRAEEFRKELATLRERIDSEFVELARKSAAILLAMSKLQDDAGDVFRVVVNTSQAGAYASYAKEERAHANRYRFGAIFLMLLSAGILVVPEVARVLADGAAGVDWLRALYRIPFSLVLFVPAFYLAKESGRHRENEVSNKRRQLILTTIHPYLELLDPERAEEIRARVAEEIFSDSKAGKTGGADVDPGAIVAQITEFARTLMKR